LASFLFQFCRLWTPHEGGKFNLCLFKNINQFVSEVNKGFQFWNIYGFFKLKDSTLQFFSGPTQQTKQTILPRYQIFLRLFQVYPPVKLKMYSCLCLNLLLIIYVETWKLWCLICSGVWFDDCRHYNVVSLAKSHFRFEVDSCWTIWM